MYLGFMGMTWGGGTVLGPIVGGLLANSKLSWRWAFYINLPIGGLIIPILILLIPKADMMAGSSIRKRLQNVDWIGSILQASFFTLFLLAFTFGGNQFAWNSPVVIGLFAGAGTARHHLFF